MSSVTASKPARKTAARSYRVLCRPAAGKPGEVRITARGESTAYGFEVLPVAPEMGRCAVAFRKESGETYHVLIADAGRRSCDCFGGLRWGKCKHGDLAPILAEQFPPAAA
jgi:hypothetical protein